MDLVAFSEVLQELSRRHDGHLLRTPTSEGMIARNQKVGLCLHGERRQIVVIRVIGQPLCVGRVSLKRRIMLQQRDDLGDVLREDPARELRPADHFDELSDQLR